MPPSLAHARRAALAPRRRHPSPLLLAALLCAVVVLAGGWLWLRQSSLVAVREVTVVGARGSQAGQIAAALREAARDMTTLHVRQDTLRTAVEPYPIVKDVEADAQLPHRLRVIVHEYVPVAALAVAGTRLPVAADGTILRDTPAGHLPVVTVAAASGARVAGRGAAAMALLDAAPAPLRRRVRRLALGPKGWSASLRSGPVLYFGGLRRLAAKWIAATRVLQDRTSAGATYVDLRLPERPAAGDAILPPDPAAQTPGLGIGTSATSTTTAPTTTTPTPPTAITTAPATAATTAGAATAASTTATATAATTTTPPAP